MKYGFDTQSYEKYGQGGFGLTKDEMVWFWHHYLASAADGQNPYVSPLLARGYEQLPFGIQTFYTDGWGAYARWWDEDQHVVGKWNTPKIERKHLT